MHYIVDYINENFLVSKLPDRAATQNFEWFIMALIQYNRLNLTHKNEDIGLLLEQESC